LSLRWFGGGLTETDPQATVEIWLTIDGVPPAGGIEDRYHRLLWQSPGSPNQGQIVQIDLDTVHYGRSEVDVAVPELHPGTYQVVAVADFEQFGRQVTPVYQTSIDVCVTDAIALPSDPQPAP
jgi:hypothetical protein